MASNYSKYSNVRVYRRYCFGAILSGLLGFCVAGAMAVILLFPFIYFQTEGGEPFSITGLQFFMYALRGIPFLKFDNLPDLLNYDKFLVFVDYINAYNGTNQMLTIIKTIFPFIEYGLAAFLAIAIIFAVVVGLLGLVFILAGRANDGENHGDDARDDHDGGGDEPPEVEHRVVEDLRVVGAAARHQDVAGDHHDDACEHQSNTFRPEGHLIVIFHMDQ